MPVPSKKDIGLFEALGEMQIDAPPAPKSASNIKPWVPKLNRGSQQTLYKSKTRNILAWSEKGSGKTFCILHKLMKHCVRWNNAMALIIVRNRSMGDKGGAWDKLNSMVVPEWERNSGIQVMPIREDKQHNEFRWIQTKDGGWSKVVFISAPYAYQIRDKMPGLEPSFVFFDELDKCDSAEFFKAPSAQIGRRHGIPGDEQQFIGACNPQGPSHWLYKLFWEESIDEETGEWDTDFEQIYFPYSDNEKNLPKGYQKSLRSTYRGDVYQLQRLVYGEWIDRPSGDSIFGEIYNVTSHVSPLTDDGKPDPRLRLQPNPKYPCFLTMDSGSTHHSFHYVQWISVDGKWKWVVFDEIVILKKRLSYSKIVPVLMNRLKFWSDLCGQMKLIAVSDQSAFSVYRPGGNAGSFDYLDMEREWNSRNEGMGLPRLKIEPSPKFDGSVKARILVLQNALGANEIVVSAACTKTQSMLLQLECEKQNENEPFDPERAMKPKRSNHLHVFDSLTYLMLLGSLKPYKLVAQEETNQSLIRVA